MLNLLQSAFSNKSIRNKIFFTLAILALYRFGSFVPVPGINPEAIKEMSNQFGDTSILNMLNMFSGGSLSRFSLFALGIMPYITSSIVMQLLGVVSPKLEKLRKEGQAGQAKITQYTRYLTVLLSAAQGVAYVFLFRTFSAEGTEVISNFAMPKLILVALALTTGSIVVMFLGEMITKRGIGNGMSLMIFASIVSGLPTAIADWYNFGDPVTRILIPFVILAIIMFVVFMQEGTRRIPIIYAKQESGANRKQRVKSTSYLPLKVNMANVIPVIFAATLMSIPPTIGTLIQQPWSQSFAEFFNYQGVPYVLGECLLIILFTFFYTAIIFNPVEQSDNLKKHGGYIPNIKPGRPTAEYLDRVLTRLTLPGSLYLAAIAAFPILFIMNTSATITVGGTSLLIVVGVAIDTIQQLQAQVAAKGYHKSTEQQLQL